MNHHLLQYCLCWLFLMSISNITFAQPQANKPVTATQVPAPSGSVAPVPGGYNANAKVSYIRSWEAKGPITDANAIVTAGYQEVQQNTQYFDGLGRPLQTVSKQITPGIKDLVTPVIHDAFGREAYKYLPYVPTAGSTNDGMFKTNPFADQAAFYQNTSLNPGLTGEQVYYSQYIFEASPLNRVLNSMAPGNSWAGSNRGVTQDYLVNTAADAVQIWNISSDPLTYANNDVTTNIPTILGTSYSTGALYKSVTKDEQGNAVVEYKDKGGLLILRKVQIGAIASDYSGYSGFLSTYYVYDRLNQLRFVIPPQAVEAIKHNWQLTTAVTNELCFRYEFDERMRTVAKKVPGAGWVYMVHDKRDRLVFSQDGNMRGRNQWLTTLYDALDRPVMTGMITYTGSRTALQNYVDQNTGTGSSSTVGVTTPVPADLYINYREVGRPLYQARNSVNIKGDFTTESNAVWETLVDANATGTTENVQVTDNPLPPGNNFTGLTITYYDNYAWTNKTYNTTYSNVLDAGNNLHAEALPVRASTMTKGLVTGTKVRAMEDPDNLAGGSWLSSVNFYDDKGRVIQVQKDNLQSGTDIVINRYDFAGKVVSNYMVNNIPAASTTANLRIKTNMEYDHAGRLLEVWKTINDESDKKALIVKNEYDELGRLKKKSLGRKKDANGNYTGTPIETLENTYNIRGWLTGINKNYSGGESGASSWFGMELNYDWGFGANSNQYNGNISGIKWRSKGDGERRAHGYSYDKLNRLLGADFSQYDGTDYADNSMVNFDMQMGDGQTASSAYDGNGNIRSMKQWGLKLNGSSVIDNMVYSYHNNSNKLRAVTEQGTGSTDHKLGDFTDRNTTADDYGYDLNGNMVTDLNKRINGSIGTDQTSGGAIQYNHLNLPQRIRVKKDDGSEKGVITYIYDATGNKLKKVTTELNASVPYNGASYSTNITTITTYLNDCIYESKEYSNSALSALAYPERLQFFSHEEGRTRYIAEAGSTPARFEHDYFVKDHLGNVRMVLTEEPQTSIYQAGIETANRSFESALFGEKVNSTASAKPGAGKFDSDDANQWVSQVNGTTAEGRIGPGVILKVMAGDRIKAHTYAWYQPTGTDNSTDPALGPLVTNLLGQLIPGISAAGKGAAAGEITQNMLQPGMEDFLNDRTDPTDRPKAYLNWILLDEEQFKKVDGSSSCTPVPVISGTQQKQLVQANSGNEVEMKKNGYLYVYVSNESRSNVYFDDIRIEHLQGPLLEETHYYPYGLTMAGISSKAFGTLDNKKEKFQGQEFNDALNVDYYEFKYRSHDPQIGRFLQIDPLSDKYTHNAPYAFSENKVTGHIELEGLESMNANESRYLWVRAAAKEDVQKHVEASRNNLANSGSLKFYVGYGLGVKGSAGPLKGELELNGPQVELAVNPEGKVQGNGSIFSAGTKVTAGNWVEAKAGTSLGNAEYKDGIFTFEPANPVVAEFGLKRKKEVEPNKLDFETKADPGTGQFGFGVKALVGIEVTVDPGRLLLGAAHAIGALVEYIRAAGDELMPLSPRNRERLKGPQ
jgi:RHS repeat-associated protein